jgi:uncharacterized membrane protein
MAALFGTGAACAILAVLAVLRWSVPGAAWLVVGGLFYLVGTIWVGARAPAPFTRAPPARGPA